MTRPEKIEEKLTRAVQDKHFETTRELVNFALAALSVEDLLGLLFTEEEREALDIALSAGRKALLGSGSAAFWTALDSAKAQLRGSDAR